jgi:hypothetical protein
MPARFDHAVVIVPSLKRAVQSFERLGFRVVLGARTGPVHNALILFSDGTYIELTTNRFSVVRPVYRAIDWCIRVDDIRDAVRRLRDLSTHPNGVTAIRRLVLPHEAKTAFECALGRVLRAEPGSTTDEFAPWGGVMVEGSRQEEMPTGPYRLELLRPGGKDEDLDPNETFDASIKLVGT